MANYDHDPLRKFLDERLNLLTSNIRSEVLNFCGDIWWYYQKALREGERHPNTQPIIEREIFRLLSGLPDFDVLALSHLNPDTLEEWEIAQRSGEEPSRGSLIESIAREVQARIQQLALSEHKDEDHEEEAIVPGFLKDGNELEMVRAYLLALVESARELEGISREILDELDAWESGLRALPKLPEKSRRIDLAFTRSNNVYLSVELGGYQLTVSCTEVFYDPGVGSDMVTLFEWCLSSSQSTTDCSDSDPNIVRGYVYDATSLTLSRDNEQSEYRWEREAVEDFESETETEPALG